MAGSRSRKRLDSLPFRPEADTTYAGGVSHRKFARFALRRQHINLDRRSRLGAAPDFVFGRYIVLLGCLEDVVDVLLRIAVDQREPSALHLNHDAMTGLEGVSHVLQR